MAKAKQDPVLADARERFIDQAMYKAATFRAYRALSVYTPEEVQRAREHCGQTFDAMLADCPWVVPGGPEA